MHLHTQNRPKTRARTCAETARLERPSRTGSPISSPSSNPEGTQEDLKTWSERKRPPPPPPPPLLLVQPISQKVPGCGLVKCIFCLSQSWLVPVKPGATGSGEALSRSSPIKFVCVYDSTGLGGFCFGDLGFFLVAFWVFLISPLLILFILQVHSNAARFISPTLVRPSLGDTSLHQDQATAGLKSQPSSYHPGENAGAATPASDHRVCHTAALVTRAAKHTAGFAWVLQQDTSALSQGSAATILQGCCSVSRITPSPSAPAQRDLAALHGLECKASNNIAAPLPKPSLQSSQQIALLHEAQQHAEQLPVIAEGSWKALEPCWQSMCWGSQQQREGWLFHAALKATACYVGAREAHDSLGYPGQTGRKMQASDEPGSLTLTEPRRFDLGLVFNQREVATSPSSTATSPNPAGPCSCCLWLQAPPWPGDRRAVQLMPARALAARRQR